MTVTVAHRLDRVFLAVEPSPRRDRTVTAPWATVAPRRVTGSTVSPSASSRHRPAATVTVTSSTVCFWRSNRRPPSPHQLHRVLTRLEPVTVATVTSFTVW